MKLGELVRNPKGARLAGIYRVSRFELKTAKNGKTYGDCYISDHSFDVPAKFWDISGEYSQILQQNLVLYIEATLDHFKEAPQLIIDSVAIPSRQEIDEALNTLGMMASQDIGQLYEALTAIIAGVECKSLKQILNYVFIDDKEFVERFKRHPGAVKNHHACIGGLLQHTVEVATTALDYCVRNPRVKKDILLAAALFHDIGKVREIEVDALGLPVGFTKAGKLLRHIYLGMELVEQACRKFNLEAELCLILKHCIYSHHGQAEWGSPVEPMILEAEILHYLDNLSAKTEQFIREEDKALPGSFNRSATLRRDIYRLSEEWAQE
ncbi:3'-5' exoribonuclease YhaM family protein [Sporomusa termitida]|uniref:3'-5' exoribonuclease YhaM n=1 Tax=Sporomusa termitida TaxID=2377 RepID=A0A517E083_9FIRM|nr:HD domain-containing protein [Sporomusa termitida]QDR83010.1 3'-5' exoribonuclease YhaM [Sporomusa termitida]